MSQYGSFARSLSPTTGRIGANPLILILPHAVSLYNSYCRTHSDLFIPYLLLSAGTSSTPFLFLSLFPISRPASFLFIHSQCSVRSLSRLLPIHVSPFSPPSYILHIDPVVVMYSTIAFHPIVVTAALVCRIVRTIPSPHSVAFISPRCTPRIPNTYLSSSRLLTIFVLAIDSHSRVIAVPTRSLASTRIHPCGRPNRLNAVGLTVLVVFLS